MRQERLTSGEKNRKEGQREERVIRTSLGLLGFPYLSPSAKNNRATHMPRALPAGTRQVCGMNNAF